MAKFSASPLKALDRIYRFVGGLRGLSEFELDGPIQPVHDIAREAELDSPIGLQGYFSITESQSHAGAGVLNDTYDPYASAPAFPGMEQSQGGIWVMAQHCTVGTGSFFVIANSSYVYPVLAGAFPASTEQLLFSFPDIVDQVTVGLPILCGDLARVTNQVTLPFFLPFGGSISINSEASDVTVIVSTIVFWAGPLGTRPPGTA